MSGILSIRIYEGGTQEEREMIVLPKGTSVLVPGERLRVTITQRQPLVCEVNVAIGSMSPEAIHGCIRALADEMAERLRERQAPSTGEEIRLG